LKNRKVNLSETEIFVHRLKADYGGFRVSLLIWF
jgi:hypothetical protein